jgi:hypothetical protein
MANQLSVRQEGWETGRKLLIGRRAADERLAIPALALLPSLSAGSGIYLNFLVLEPKVFGRAVVVPDSDSRKRRFSS